VDDAAPFACGIFREPQKSATRLELAPGHVFLTLLPHARLKAFFRMTYCFGRETALALLQTSLSAGTLFCVWPTVHKNCLLEAWQLYGH
jgi:hypothetical protein